MTPINPMVYQRLAVRFGGDSKPQNIRQEVDTYQKMEELQQEVWTAAASSDPEQQKVAQDMYDEIERTFLNTPPNPNSTRKNSNE